MTPHYADSPTSTTPYQWVPPVPQQKRPPLRRATARSADMPTPWAAGICAGLSVHMGMPVTFVRIIMVVTFIPFGAGLLLYLWLWVMVPQDTGVASNDTRIAGRLRAVAADRRAATARNQLLLTGVVTLLIAAMLAVLSTSGVVQWRILVATVVLIIGLTLIWSRAANTQPLRSPVQLASVLAGVLLVLVALVILLLGNDPIKEVVQGAIVGAVLVAGVGLALLPLALRASRDLSASREEQVRDAERADIAAHLHDSVLQTLTLIRGAADDPQRVRALALSQERELRSWLYTGKEEAASSIAEALREAVGQIETTHGIAVDVVTVGDAVPGPSELALVAAGAEAVKNAVRHGAPPVSVYLEVDRAGTDIYVKDAGPGFDIDAIPDDRHGVKGSILGRMERVGGTATIRRRSPGTEVHLHVPSASSRPVAF
ncbi:ATP-binding protein [Schaalia suimastitidis]|uniref:ATP-binding protein n=1 Tax=Schaalia suimastitidis TaxID=121163 RepID=UPI001F0B558F|nr:ATP-binding protein [Schaalia suimastitidis]